MSDTLLRQWELLRAIPRAPRKVDVATLMARLASSGYRISKRSLQRDLNQLSRVFPLQCDDRATTFGWSWSAEAPAFDLPSMDGPTALALRMIEQFIPTLLPPVLSDLLAPQFARAKAVLGANPNNPLGRWTDCVRVVPREMPLLAPRIHEETMRVVYQSLLDGKRIQVTYTPRQSEGRDDRDYEVNPLGIVVRGSLIYLVCTLWDYQDIRQLALHRIRSAEIRDIPAAHLKDFDLDRYITDGGFQYPVGPMIQLRVKFSRAAAAHLYETPLSADQTIQELGPDQVLVTATVRDSAQLEWWLMGFGSGLEVVEPLMLRNRISVAVRDTHASYA